MASENENGYVFADFTLDVREHHLLKGKQEKYLRPKTFETLLYLVKRAGRLVKKTELLDQVWADTFVTENTLSQCIKEIRQTLQDDIARPRYVKTIPRVGYKFIAPVTEVHQETKSLPEVEGGPILDEDQVSTSKQFPPTMPGWNRHRQPFSAGRNMIGALLIGLVVVMTVAYFIFKPESVISFAARDWLLVTDFENHTGEQIFASALRTALERELSRSVYVNAVPPARVLDILRLMQRDPVEKIDEQVGREICLRDGGIRAMLSGSIQEIGGRYAIMVKLIEPANGVTVSSFSEQAGNRQEVLPAIRRLAVAVRKKLGESLTSITRTEKGLEHVSTPSLEALKLYSKGWRLKNLFDWEQARYFFEQAIHDDSSFAMSYLGLGFTHLWLGQLAESRANFERAAQWAESVTGREKYFILGSHASYGLGDFQQAIANYQVLVELYPDHYWGHENLSQAYLWAGDFRRCMEHKQVCARIRPYYAINHSDLGVLTLFIEQDVEKAHHEFSRALELNPELPFELPHLSEAFQDWMDGDLDLVESKMQAFLSTRTDKLLPDFRVTSRWLVARFYLFSGKFDQALELLEASLTRALDHPKSNLTPWSRMELALTHWELGHIELFEVSMKTTADQTVGIARVQALGWLGSYFASSGDTLQAQQLIRQFMAEERQMAVGIIQPPLPMELDRAKGAFSALIQGKIALRRGNANQAIKHFKQVIELVPASQMPALTALNPRILLVAYQSLAHAYEQQQKWDAAITAYQAILDLKVLTITVPAASPIWVKALYSISHPLEKKDEIEKANFYREQHASLWPSISGK
ncbi:MAG: winged helix-turn-helix domain-containing protein [bacterium]